MILIKQIRTFSYDYPNHWPIICCSSTSNLKQAVRKLASVTTSLLLKCAALVLSALALGTLLFGRLHVDAEAPAPPFDLLITNARIVDGSGNPWLFSYDFTARPSELNPDGAYLYPPRRLLNPSTDYTDNLRNLG